MPGPQAEWPVSLKRRLARLAAKKQVLGKYVAPLAAQKLALEALNAFLWELTPHVQPLAVKPPSPWSSRRH